MVARFRPLLVVLAALAVWLVARPARAAAPLCDDRGASSLAPAPTLDTPNASIDIGMGPEPCQVQVELDASFHQGRAPNPLPAPVGAELLPAHARVTVLFAGTELCLRVRYLDASRSGVVYRLDRPPRELSAQA